MSMDDRALREKKEWNVQSIDRETYYSVFSHTHAYYGAHSRSSIKRAFCYAEGNHILELGASWWYEFIYLNNIRPRKITCINISEMELEKGIQMYNGSKDIDMEFMIMDANRLEFEDESFDMVYGGGMLHHLDLSRALPEIHRVLKKDGQIVFHEPLGANPAGKIVRFMTPGSRTKDEKPLGCKELREIDCFFDARNYYEQFFSVPLGIISYILKRNPKNILTKCGYHIDCFLDANVPILRPFFRTVLIHGKKRFEIR